MHRKKLCSRRFRYADSYTKRFSEQERNSQDEYPKDETEIEVTGTFETYKESEDDMLYGHLVNSKLQIKEKRKK